MLEENADRLVTRARKRPAVFIALLALLILVAGALAACDLSAVGLSFGKPSSRILFIGNSFTFYNDGVDQQLKRMDPSIAVERIAVGGYTLQDHWNSGQALTEIQGSKWDYVVLQEQSQTPVTGRPRFIEYAGKFGRVIQAAGGQTVLFMTWQRPDSVQFGVTTQALANAYYDAADAAGARVAPAGIAFANALWERPELSLNIQDGHPTPAGTYLAACVIYGTLFDKSPVGLSYAPAGISGDDRAFLQRIAAESTGH